MRIRIQPSVKVIARGRRSIVAACAAVALLLVACGGDDAPDASSAETDASSAGTDEMGGAAGSDAAEGAAGSDAAEGAAGSDAAEDVASGDAADNDGTDAAGGTADGEAPTDEGSSDSSLVSGPELAAEDGWNGPLDLDVDHYGEREAQAVLAGEAIDMEVWCESPMVAEQGAFLFAVAGGGSNADGHHVEISAFRRITNERTTTETYDGYEYGALNVYVNDPDELKVLEVDSPGRRDPNGALLPVVRVEGDGTFSAVVDLAAPEVEGSLVEEFGGDGGIEFSGRCQDDWNGPIFED